MQQIIWKKTSEIIPYEKNPRINDSAVEYVANSLQNFGWKQPIVVDKDFVIIAGHTRLKAAKKLKMETVKDILHYSDRYCRRLRRAGVNRIAITLYGPAASENVYIARVVE